MMSFIGDRHMMHLQGVKMATCGNVDNVITVTPSI